MERHEIDLDNFIREKIRGPYPRGFAVEAMPDFTKRTMDRICRLEKRRQFFALLGGLAMLWVLSPLTLKYIWLLVRNDYFSVSRLPFGGTIVEVYQFALSLAGTFLLVAVGIFVSFVFVSRLHRNYRSPAISTAKA